jgi:AbrB family looped-hinge helix DNA binding protein
MMTSIMTIKGQVTVPKALRDAFGWKVGDEVAFVRENDGVKIIRAPHRRRGRAIVERLKRAPWNDKLTTDRLMALTRGKQR